MESYIESDFSKINENILGKINMEERNINESLLFNSDLLERCRTFSPRIVQSLNGYGKLVENELQLIDMRQVHPAGKEIRNNKTGKVLPKGFQVRTDITIDHANRDAILHDIEQKDWNTHQRQIILFLLPEEYRYVNSDGIEVIYGILDGNHRYDAASMAAQENIIAWLVDMPINKLRKYGNAEANRQQNSSKPRSNQDIADSIKIDLDDSTTQLSKDVKKAEDDDKLNVRDVLSKELDDYHVHFKTKQPIIRIIIDESNIVVDRKDYDAPRREVYVSEFCPTWIKVKGKDWDYETKDGVRVILIEASGSNDLIVSGKISRMQDSNTPISICFSNAKGQKITKENRNIVRRQFMEKIYKNIRVIGKADQKLFVDKTGVIPSFECLPELADELDTNNLIRVI
jgi:hypothetical protein